PFNIKVGNAVGDKPDISFSKGKPQQVILRNEDAMTYQVYLVIAVEGDALEFKEHVQLPPNSSETISLDPKDSWFTTAGWFRDEVRDGNITVAFRPPGTTADAGWPTKVIPFKARLNRTWAGWLGYIAIFILLLLGGICSLLLSNWVPNQTARGKLKARLG